MNFFKSAKKFFSLLFIIGSLFLLFPSHLKAADSTVSITSCKLNSKGTKVTVKAKISKSDASYGKKLYLLVLDGQASETKARKATPLTSTKNKKGSVTFKVKYQSTMLYQKFALAYKTNGKYKLVSNTCYITNPEVLATYTGTGPKTISKKGLQVEDLDEAIELRTQHAVINWTVDSLLTTNCANTLAYKYRGTTYYFNADMLAYNDSQVQAYNAAGAKVSIILLLPNSSNAQTDSMRYQGSSTAKYSSFNTSTKKGCRTFEALMSYLAARYGTKENFVAGWILGNEVNSPYEWNYGGNKKLSTYMENYTRAFRICYNAVKSVSKNSNVYISLDYNWKLDADPSGNHYFSAKAVLDEFYRQIKLRGNIVFHIAYHAYPQSLKDPVFWDDDLATDSVDSSLITFKNLKVLTNYVKKNFGKSYTIMLSEQSFNSNKGEAVQAAAYAYAYYLAETNSMIESFIYGRHFDNPVEMEQDFYWGLSDSSHTKRMIWHVFQNIDTSDSFQFTNQLVKYTNLKAWTKISGFKKEKYTKMPSLDRTPVLGNITMDATNTATLFWSKVNYVDGYEIYRNDTKIATIMDASTLGYTDTGLTTGEIYTYKICSFKFIPGKTNANEKGALFSVYSAGQTIIATTGKASWNTDNCSVSGKNISLSWTKQTGVSGYEIARSTSENGTYTAIAGTTKISYTDKDTVTGTTYYYKVRAYVTQNGTNYYGEYSDVLSLQAAIQLNAEVIDSQLTFSWTACPEAAKYQIYFSSASDESFTKMYTTKDAEALTYTCVNYKVSGETGYFAIGETYHFKVRAVYSDKSTSSYSNVADITIEDELISSEGSMQALDTEEAETSASETEEVETETTEIEADDETETTAAEADDETETTAAETNDKTETTETETNDKTETTETEADDETETTDDTEIEDTEK